MQAYHVTHGGQTAGLTLATLPAVPSLAPDEVRVRVKAVSLNYRDLMVTKGIYPIPSDAPVVPGSDFAGEVIETGTAVQGVKTGDRVMASFFPDWDDGTPTPEKLTRSFGADSDGGLREEVVLRADDLVSIPDSLDFVEASTLPCAGVTAWNALFEKTDLTPGSTVLLLGTGGVSIMALQLAKAAGHKVIITSSSVEKLDKARALGADGTVNYVEQPEWQEAVLSLTGGKGADLVLEVGGKETVQRSIAALGMGGRAMIIGGVSGFTGSLDPISLLFGGKTVGGFMVGSTAMLKSLARFVEANNITPIIDSVFDFQDARQAYEYLEAGKHFGKVVIRVQ